jgi:hypothetical protein
MPELRALVGKSLGSTNRKEDTQVKRMAMPYLALDVGYCKKRSADVSDLSVF